MIVVVLKYLRFLRMQVSMSEIPNTLRYLPSGKSSDYRDYFYYFRIFNETLYPYFTSAKEAAARAFSSACESMDIEDTCKNVEYAALRSFSLLIRSGIFVYHRGVDLKNCAKWVWGWTEGIPGRETALGALICSSICFAVLYHRGIRVMNKVETAPIFINSAPSAPLVSPNRSDPDDQPTDYRRFFENLHVVSN
jgi:hypothetical protein